MTQHTWGKLLIHGKTTRKDKQSQSLKYTYMFL